MVEFSEKDIWKLDYIIDYLVETGFQTSFPDLIREDKFKNKNPEFTYIEFNRLASIIDGMGCAQVYLPGNMDLTTVIRPNGRTAYFKANGGFKKKYSELLENRKHSEIVRKKERNDAKLSDWQVKTFWPVLIFGLFGGIYSGIDLIGKFTKKETISSEMVSQKQLKTELEKLQNLIMEKKDIDSLLKFEPTTRIE